MTFARIALSSSLLLLFTLAGGLAGGLTGCSACTAPPGGEGEGEGQAGEGEGEGEGEGQAGEGEGEGEGQPPTPRLIVGGGAGDGAINGTLFVHVVDDQTGDPVVGVFVRVEPPNGGGNNIEHQTDAAGLATFTDPAVVGAQDVTVHGAAVVHTSWLGIDAVNITVPVPVLATTPGAPESGTADLRIPGIDAIVLSGGADYVNVIANQSDTRNLGDPANALDDFVGLRCSTHPLANGVGTPPQCSSGFTMTTRTGAIAIEATIVQMEDHGTVNPADDTVVGVRTYAIARNLTIVANATTGANLTIIGDNDLTNATLNFPAAAPAGLGTIGAFVAIDVGDEGVLVTTLFRLNDNVHVVPALTGSLAGTSYQIVAIAQPNGGGVKQSASLLYTLADVSSVTVPEWLFPPANINVTSGGLHVVYGASAGAAVNSLEIRAAGAGTGPSEWGAAVFDGRTTVVLPTLADDPIATGAHACKVTAIDSPAFDPASFTFSDVVATLARLAEDASQFTK